MNTVILAAGKGSRLDMATPKAMVEIEPGSTILDIQLQNLTRHIPLQNISVVVGFMKEKVQASHPELHYICNEYYDTTNTGKSLLRALEELGTDEDILWLNGDVVFDAELIPRLLEQQKNSVLVDNKKCGEEEVKYNTCPDGCIAELSKAVLRPEGEALGINIIKTPHVALFKKHLTAIGEQDYFEKALENMITHDAIKIIPVNAGDLFCHEIDFPEDLQHVRKNNYNG